MDVPLGRAVGNALEVAEAVETLEGRGPADLVEVTVALAEVMLELAGLPGDPLAGASGRLGAGVWRAMVRAQGGDPDAPLPVAPVVEPVLAERGRLPQPPGGPLRRRRGLAPRGGQSPKGRPGPRQRRGALPGQAGGAGNKGQPLLELHTDDPSAWSAPGRRSGELGHRCPRPRLRPACSCSNGSAD